MNGRTAAAAGNTGVRLAPAFSGGSKIDGVIVGVSGEACKVLEPEAIGTMKPRLNGERRDAVLAAPRLLTREIAMPETTDTPVLDLLADMTASSIETSTLDAETLMLVRIAALVAVDAPPASYLFNIGAATDLDIDAEQVRGVLAAVAPIVGTAKIVSALGKIVRALELELDLAELDAEATV